MLLNITKNQTGFRNKSTKRSVRVEMKRFTSKNVKGSFFGFIFCVYNGQWRVETREKRVKRPLVAGENLRA